jgi:outer membrane protein OmpA-like peptidoglycan-associated protein
MFLRRSYLYILLSLFCKTAHSQIKADTLRLMFDINQFSAESNYRRMDSLIKALQGKIVQVKIIGYADFLHNDVYNLSLSQKRAEDVRNYLVKTAEPGQINRIESKGLGERFSKDNGSVKGEPLQRRVDLIVEPFTITVEMEDKKPKIEAKNAISNKIEKMTVGESVAVEGINFEPGRHYWFRESIPVLQRLVSTLKENPTLKIEIQGHICCVEGNEDGLDIDTKKRKLSENRAKAVYDYLVENGIDPLRLTHKGYARTKPKVDPERNPRDEQKNRRVEIKIIEK